MQHGRLRSRLQQTNPAPSILKRYREMGGELITVGSDAHTQEYMGYGFEQARELLKSCGFRYYTVFHHRKAETIPL